MAENKTCKHVDDETQTECNDVATEVITIKGSVSTARVDVCYRHKAEHNRRAADLRLSRK